MDQLKQLVVLGGSGVLPSGLEWRAMDGELWVFSKNAAGEKAWIVPVWGLLDPEDADEMVCLGTILNQELDHMKDEAREYGRAWMEVILEDGEANEWNNLTWPEFQQALSNANSPSFTWRGGTDTDYSGLEGEFFAIASEAVWDTLEDSIAAEEDPDEEDPDED